MSSCKSRRFVSFLVKRLWRKLIETILLLQLGSFAAVSRDVTQRSPERNISGVRHPERRLGRSLKHNRPVSLFWRRRLLLLLLFLLLLSFFIIIISIVISFIFLLMFSCSLWNWQNTMVNHRVGRKHLDQRYTFYLIFLWTDTKLIVNLELREKFTGWKKKSPTVSW